MSSRGPYAKGVAKREAILAVALDLIARVGYSNTTVREIAAAVGSTPTRVIYYFGTKEDLFAEVLRRRDAETTTRLNREAVDTVGGLRSLFTDLLVRNEEVAGLMQLDTRLRVEASDPDHKAHEYFQDRYSYARWAIADTVQHLKELGALAPEADAELLATMLIALVEGLQAQRLYTDAVDPARVVSYAVELIETAIGTGSRTNAGSIDDRGPEVGLTR